MKVKEIAKRDIELAQLLKLSIYQNFQNLFSNSTIEICH